MTYASKAWWVAAAACFASAELVVLGIYSQAPLMLFGLALVVFAGAWLPTSGKRQLSWSSNSLWVVGFTALFFGCAILQFKASLPIAAALTLGVGLLLTLSCTFRLWLQLGRNSSAGALVPYLSVLMFLIMAPVFLSPIAELWVQHQWLGNLAIALSPYSYLASWAQYDYLREPWFYQHTAYGGLRFAYPSTLTLSLCYLGTTALLLVLVNSRPRATSALANSPHVSPNDST